MPHLAAAAAIAAEVQDRMSREAAFGVQAFVLTVAEPRRRRTRRRRHRSRIRYDAPGLDGRRHDDGRPHQMDAPARCPPQRRHDA